MVGSAAVSEKSCVAAKRNSTYERRRVFHLASTHCEESKFIVRQSPRSFGDIGLSCCSLLFLDCFFAIRGQGRWSCTTHRHRVAGVLSERQQYLLLPPSAKAKHHGPLKMTCWRLWNLLLRKEVRYGLFRHLKSVFFIMRQKPPQCSCLVDTW